MIFQGHSVAKDAKFYLDYGHAANFYINGWSAAEEAILNLTYVNDVSIICEMDALLTSTGEKSCHDLQLYHSRGNILNVSCRHVRDICMDMDIWAPINGIVNVNATGSTYIDFLLKVNVASSKKLVS